MRFLFFLLLSLACLFLVLHYAFFFILYLAPTLCLPLFVTYTVQFPFSFLFFTICISISPKTSDESGITVHHDDLSPPRMTYQRVPPTTSLRETLTKTVSRDKKRLFLTCAFLLLTYSSWKHSLTYARLRNKALLVSLPPSLLISAYFRFFFSLFTFILCYTFSLSFPLFLPPCFPLFIICRLPPPRIFHSLF